MGKGRLRVGALPFLGNALVASLLVCNKQIRAKLGNNIMNENKKTTRSSNSTQKIEQNLNDMPKHTEINGS